VSTENALRNVLSRSWMHGRLWLNDPDCLMVRDSETALTPDEIRTLTTAIGLSGGMVLDSDDLTRLSPERREMISMLLPVHGKPAVPRDLFEADAMPRLYELDCRTHRMLGVFNWSDEPGTVSVPLPDETTHVFEVWKRQYLGAIKGSLDLELPPHGCALFRLTPALDRPQVVGTTFHLLQGAAEISGDEWDSSTLRLTLQPVAKRDGEIFITVPDGFGDPSADGSKVRRPGDERIWALTLQVDEPRELIVGFG
jgi:alpha-galactosidase